MTILENQKKRLIERVKDYGGIDTKSHVLKHSSEEEHVEVTQDDFKIIGSHLENNTLRLLYWQSF